MSFQLVVVALLAATAAASGNSVVTLVCSGAGCSNSCQMTTYPAGGCKEESQGGGSKVYWRAEECTTDTKTFVIKGYSSKDDCDAPAAAQTESIPTACTAQATKLVCSDSKVTLYSCDTEDKCTTSPDECKKTEFMKEQEIQKCQGALGKMLKVPESAFTSDCGGGASVMFAVHTKSDCSDTSSSNVEVQVACTKSYYKATCTAENGLVKQKCTDDMCNDGGCTTDLTLPLGQYQKVEHSYWYLKSCPAAASDPIPVETYTMLQLFKDECTEEGDFSSSAKCTTAESTGDSSNNSSSSDNSSSSNNSSAGDSAADNSSTAAPGDSTAAPGAGESTAAPGAGESTTKDNNTSNTNNSIEDGATARSIAPISFIALLMLAYAL